MAEEERASWSDGPAWTRVLTQAGAMGVICFVFSQWSDKVWTQSEKSQAGHLATLAEDRKHDRDQLERTVQQLERNTAAVQRLETSVSALLPAIETLTREVRVLKLTKE